MNLYACTENVIVLGFSVVCVCQSNTHFRYTRMLLMALAQHGADYYDFAIDASFKSYGVICLL